jgi:3-phosphoshikimate 1-carboxyvinyltransferase
MGRIAEPLRLMGAHVLGATPPLTIVGGELNGIAYRSPVASAQIKTCTLLAGLRAGGPTSVLEPSVSRDHTERMLSAMGVRIERTETEAGHEVALVGGQIPRAFEMTIPGDISSAAFIMVAAVGLPDSELDIRDLSVNPTRTGVLDVLAQCGAPAKVGDQRLELGEPVADVAIRAPKRLKPFTIEGSLVPRLIDEIPVLAVLATQCDGVSVIRNARELRVKESDRIEAIAGGLRAMGAKVDTFDDGMSIFGPTPLHGIEIDCLHDHRIAMAFAVAGLMSDGETTVVGAETIETSYPEFLNDLTRLCVV